MKNILPVQYPVNDTWPWHAAAFSILPNIADSENWIYSNYIQTNCGIQWDDLFLDFFPGDLVLSECPLFFCQMMKRSFINTVYKGDITKFLIDSIDAGNYIFGVFDEAMMLKYEEKTIHELFIFGYDLDESLFYVADFTFKGKYSFEKVPFEAVIHGYHNVGEHEDYRAQFKGGIYLISVNSNGKKYHFDAGFVKDSLVEYLTSYDSQNCSRDTENVRGNTVCGMAVYDRILEYLSALKSGNRKFDQRALHNLYVHKIINTKRVEYMFKIGIIQADTELLESFANLEHLALSARNQMVKYGLQNKERHIQRVIDLVAEIKKLEPAALNLLIEKLTFYRTTY